ncbi:MAG: 4-hydroxy-tetrahydrodipicolinate reductase [Spirochaetales bacterium]
MRIAIVGYGRMGRMIEQIARQRKHEVTLVVDPQISGDGPGQAELAKTLTAESLTEADVAIEFSLPEGVKENVARYIEAAVPAVIGTTGWLDQLDDITKRIKAADGALLYGANFSIGAHVFFKAAEYATSLVAELPEYDLAVHEMHHSNKKDSPSGTALTLANRVIAAHPRKSKIETARFDRAPEEDELHVSSTRGGAVPGTHTLYLDSQADTVEVRHTARSREGFALGAVRAAEWLVGKKGVFEVEEFISELLER